MPNSSISLITGANRGLGRASALDLARHGGTVVLGCRDVRRGQDVVAEIQKLSGNSSIELLPIDLSSLASVRSAAAEFSNRHQTLDVLINNASIYKKDRVLTPEGFETMFVTNHLGPFVLTNLLLDSVKSAKGRILTVSAPSMSRVEMDNLQSEKKFRALDAFGASKFCNLLFAYALSRRLEGTGVTSNIFFPGLVKSDLMAETKIAHFFFNLISLPPEKAAADLAYVATAPQFAPITSKFISGRKLGRQAPTSLVINLQEALWTKSVELAGFQ